MAKSVSEKESDKRILKLFRHRCVVCMRPADCVHELITRGRTKKAIELPQNRVPLCNHDHNNAHADGYTEEKEEMLRQLAIIRLTQYGESLESW